MNKAQIAVIGAGPAGLSAALEAARAGAQVTVIDENRKPGGQLFKQIHKFFGSRQHQAGTRGFAIGQGLLRDCEELGVSVQLGYPALGIFPDGRVVFNTAQGVRSLFAQRIILATGANENNLYFEGSDLPGVMTAGAAQTMINEHRVLPGQRVLMVGTGNVGLIISYQLLQAGAEVVALVEAAPQIGGYAVHASKLRRAGVPIYTSRTIHRAIGEKTVEGVELVALNEHFQPVPGTGEILCADTVCMAVGLSPMVELAALAGCQMTHIPALGGTIPLHDKNLCTTNPMVYVAGDIAGVEEASTAIEEGRLAGIAAARSLGLGDDGRQQAVQERLLALRSGEFGAKRQQAKEDILRTFKEAMA